MKKLLLVLAASSMLSAAMAQSQGFGLGIMIGDPTGLNGKAWTSGDKAIQFGLAWGLWHGSYVHVHGDYLFHKMDLIPVSKGRLPVYFGPGLRIRSWNGGRYWNHGQWNDYDGSRVSVGFRLPVGLAYLFDGAPLDVFIEAVPTLDLAPATYFDLDGAIGARFWF